jgi:hypothetical protein
VRGYLTLEAVSRLLGESAGRNGDGAHGGREAQVEHGEAAG